jgi:hypothetical protein
MDENFLSFSDPVINQFAKREEVLKDLGVVVPTDMEVLRFLGRTCDSRSWQLGIRGLEFPSGLK